ncbi:MAG: IS3 family transposase [Mobilitalea sp.]
MILGISRSSYYYEPKEVPEDPELAILEAVLEVLKEKPFYGYRRIARELAYLSVTRKPIRRIMKKAGLRAIYPGLQLSKPSKGSKKYPYLCKGINIWLPNQV